MMVYIGIKEFLSIIPMPRSRSQTKNFHANIKMFAYWQLIELTRKDIIPLTKFLVMCKVHTDVGGIK